MPRTARVLALANQKGGVAKTTTTLNLGVALKDMGARVLAVNLDPQSNLSMSQGIDVEALGLGMYHVLTGSAAITEIIQAREIDVAPAGIELAGAELALSATIGRERALERALRPVRELYDYVLLDTPPSLGLLDHQRDGGVRGCHRARPVRISVAARDSPSSTRRSSRCVRT